MKRLAIVLCVVILGCGKNNTDPLPVHSSPDGTWTYTTPDKAMSVQFDLKTTGSTLEILNTTIKIDQQDGIAAGVLSGVNVPAVDQIQINANDPVLVYSYKITFINCTFSEDFNFISVDDVQYTYPNVKTLQSISIGRK